MNSIGFVRTKLGVTQQVLANLLGTPRSTLAMAEKGERPLPYAASIRLAELQLAFQQPATFTPAEPELEQLREADAVLKTELETLVQNRDEEFVSLEAQLAAMRSAHTDAITALQTIAVQQQDLALTDEFRLGLELDRDTQLEKWMRTRPWMQQLLELKRDRNRLERDQYALILSQMTVAESDPFS